VKVHALTCDMGEDCTCGPESGAGFALSCDARDPCTPGFRALVGCRDDDEPPPTRRISETPPPTGAASFRVLSPDDRRRAISRGLEQTRRRIERMRRRPLNAPK